MRVHWRPLVALFLVPACSIAQETLTFAEAARRTLAERPEFRVHARRFDVLAAQRGQAALRPGYTLSLEAENVLGTGTLSGKHGAEWSLSLGRLWERGGKRDARVAVATANGAAIDRERDIAALDLVAETARQYVALAVAQERLSEAREAAAQAGVSLQLTQQRHAAAQAPETEVLNASIALAETELGVDRARRAVTQAQQLLGAQWNAPDSAPVAQLEVLRLESPAPLPRLLAQLDATPDLLRHASEARVAEAELALARTQASADLSFSGGFRRLEESDDQALVFAISVPLGSAARAQPAIAERVARLSQIEAERHVTRVRLESLLRRQWLALDEACATERLIRERQLEPARRVVAQTRRGFGMGRFAWRELATAERQLRDLQRQRLEAAASYHLTRVEIERLTGALPVTTSTTEARHAD